MFLLRSNLSSSVEDGVDRDVQRLSKVRPPTTRSAMERREAPGPFAWVPAPRDPSTPQRLSLKSLHLGPGISARGQRIATLAWRRFAPSAGASRRSVPLLWEREGKQGHGRSRASEKQTPGTAERWLKV